MASHPLCFTVLQEATHDFMGGQHMLEGPLLFTVAVLPILSKRMSFRCEILKPLFCQFS